VTLETATKHLYGSSVKVTLREGSSTWKYESYIRHAKYNFETQRLSLYGLCEGNLEEKLLY
jgi:hypothetical protein